MSEFNYNTLRTVLPFYPSLDHQNRNKSWCKDQMQMFQLICPRTRFLPFQIIRPANPVTTYTWQLYEVVNDSFVQTITFPAGQIDTATLGGLDYITYFGTDVFSAIDCGKYWIYWTDGTNVQYSEVITIRDFTDNTFENLRKYGDDTQLRLIDLTEIRKTTS